MSTETWCLRENKAILGKLVRLATRAVPRGGVPRSWLELTFSAGPTTLSGCNDNNNDNNDFSTIETYLITEAGTIVGTDHTVPCPGDIRWHAAWIRHLPVLAAAQWRIPVTNVQPLVVVAALPAAAVQLDSQNQKHTHYGMLYLWWCLDNRKQNRGFRLACPDIVNIG